MKSMETAWSPLWLTAATAQTPVISNWVMTGQQRNLPKSVEPANHPNSLGNYFLDIFSSFSPAFFFSFSSFRQSLFLPPLCLRLPVQLKPYFLRGIFKFLSPCIGGTNPGIGGTAAVVTLQGSLNKQIILNTGLTRFCNNTQNKLLSYQCGCFPISLHCINYVHRHNPPSAQSLTGHLFASFMWWDGIEALMPSSCSWRFSKDIMLWAHPSIRQSKCIPLYGNTICEIPKC